MATCQSCGVDNPGGAKFCSECGGRLETRGDPTSDHTVSDERTIVGKAKRPGESGDAGSIFGRFHLLEKLGEGGMGVVWKAEDRKFSPPRLVALKRLRAAEARDAQAIARFLQEAGAVAQLNHRNIVTVHDVGEDDEGHFIVMELVDGQTLSELIRAKGRLPIEEGLRIAREIGSALWHAHKKRVIHRDVKPGNILIARDGTAKVLDFGLARIASGTELSRTGFGMGTMDYASPEQKRDAKNVDHRSDIYSFGATLYQMFTGETPRTIRAERIPPGIDRVVLKCLEEQPEERYFSVEEILTDLEAMGEKGGSAAQRKVVVHEDVDGDCPGCGTSNPAEARFCRRCGAGLYENCVSCGKEIRGGIAHCIHCGVSVPQAKKAKELAARARAALERHQYDHALKDLEAALKLMPRDAEAAQLRTQAVEKRAAAQRLRQQAEELVTREEFEGAEKPLTAYLALAPDDEEAKKLAANLPRRRLERDLRRAAKAEEDGEDEKALTLYARVLERDPENAQARAGRERAVGNKARGHLSRARESLEGCAYEAAVREAGAARELRDKDEEIEGILCEAIEKRDAAKRVRDEVKDLVESGRADAAAARLQRYLASAPGDAAAANMLKELPARALAWDLQAGEAAEKQGDLHRALRSYTRAAERDSGNAAARAGRARVTERVWARRCIRFVCAVVIAVVGAGAWMAIDLSKDTLVGKNDKPVDFTPTGKSLTASTAINIGAIFAVTGPAAFIGYPQKNTAEMLEKQINAAGGINGARLKVIVRDSAGDNEKAIAAARQLIEDENVVAIIGPTRSGGSLAIKGICEQARTPNISCAAAEAIVLDPQTNVVPKYVFKSPQKDSYVAQLIFKTMKDMGITKIGVVAEAGGFGDGGKAQLAKYAPEYGIEIAASESFDPKAADLTPVVTKIQAAGVHAVVNWSIVPAQSKVPVIMKQIGLAVPLFHSHGFGNIKYVEAAGEAAEGIIFAGTRLLIADELPAAHPQRNVLVAYKKDYEAAFPGEQVSVFGGYAYDALMIAVKAIRKAGTNKEKIRDAIESMDFVGTGGVFQFTAQDHNGLGIDSLEVLTVKGGKFAQYKK